MTTFYKTETDSLLKIDSTEMPVQLLLFLFLASLKNQGQNVALSGPVNPRHTYSWSRKVGVCPPEGAALLSKERGPKYLVKVTIIIAKAYITEYLLHAK